MCLLSFFTCAIMILFWYCIWYIYIDNNKNHHAVLDIFKLVFLFISDGVIVCYLENASVLILYHQEVHFVNKRQVCVHIVYNLIIFHKVLSNVYVLY